MIEFFLVNALTFYYRRDRAQERCQIGIKLGQIGPTWDFLRSVSVHFGSASKNVLKLIFKKKSQICPIWGSICPHFDAKFNILDCALCAEVVRKQSCTRQWNEPG